MRKKKKVAIAIAGGAVLLVVLGLIFVPRIQASIERAEAERWILENLDVQENEFAPQELVDAVWAEYMTEEEADQKGLSLDEWVAYNFQKTDASERLCAWIRENHRLDIDLNDENIAIGVERSSYGVPIIRERAN